MSGSERRSEEVRETSNTVLKRLGYTRIDLNQWAVRVCVICVCACACVLTGVAAWQPGARRKILRSR